MKTKVFLISLIATIGLLYFTCPTEHKLESCTIQALRDCAKEENPLAGLLLGALNDDYMQLLTTIGGHQIVSKNYLLFSATWLVDEDDSELKLSEASSIGVLGQVYVFTKYGTKHY